MSMQSEDPALVVDDRERAGPLCDALAGQWPAIAIRRLPLGDVEIGPHVLVERKTVADFVASLADGRLLRQAYALSRAVRRPLIIVEGTDGAPFAGVAPAALRGALLSIAVGCRVPLVRTDDAAETAEWLVHLARQEQRRLRRHHERHDRRAGAQSARLLGAIPGVGDQRVKTLIEHFGNPLRALSATERELAELPGIGRATARAVRDAARSPPSGDSDPEVRASANPARRGRTDPARRPP